MTIQKMIDAIDCYIKDGLDERLTLKRLASEIGYSEFHTTRHFRRLAGMTFREYLQLRRLAFSVIELRDSGRRIIDIAAAFGFSSQEAFTRAFKKAYGITPDSYRRKVVPLKLQLKCSTFDRYFLGIGEIGMDGNKTKEVRTYFTTLAAHKFLHIKNYESDGYWDFWKRQDNIPGQDCDTICGILDSIQGKLDGDDSVIGKFSGQIMGNCYESDGRTCEAYGVRLAMDYQGGIPEQMLCVEVPESDYVVFEHLAFDYEQQGNSVAESVHEAERKFDITGSGYEFELCGNRFGYFFHDSDKYYKIMKPVKKLACT